MSKLTTNGTGVVLTSDDSRAEPINLPWTPNSYLDLVQRVITHQINADNVWNGDPWVKPQPFVYPQLPDTYRSHPSIPPPDLGEQLRHIVEQCQQEKKEKAPPMRGLFQVLIVDPDKDDIVYETVLVAADAAVAKLKAAVKANLPKDVDEYDFAVVKLGDVRPKQKVKEVKVING